MYRFFLMTIIVWFCVSALPGCVNAENLSLQVSEALKNRIKTERAQQKIVCAGELICASALIPLFYEGRSSQPVWSRETNLLPQVGSFIKTIYGATREGLKPYDYHIAKIESILEVMHQDQIKRKHFDPERLVDLDLLLTDAFLIYSSHLLYGRVNPETIHSEWIMKRIRKDLIKILNTALYENKMKESLKSLLPQHPDYMRLRTALTHYRNIAKKGGWPRIPNGTNIKKGDFDKRISLLRNRLIAEGYLDQMINNDGELLDNSLDLAIRTFQGRHGLRVDGIVGPLTLSELNKTVEERITQIEVNMERWRWLPGDLGKRYIVVNTANFSLELVENSMPAMTMRVVVGKLYRRTPVFSGKMTYLVFNPYWHIPLSIARKDILPKIQKDPDYLAGQKIKVFQSWNYGAPEMDQETIDWSGVNHENFIYKLRQDPGPLNALGRVKFMFPNKFNVYLHDTPAQKLFQKTRRDFSSGCIRIEKPIELAEDLLRNDPKWSREEITAAINRGMRQIVRLPEPITVHVLYWTAWMDRDGFIQFRNDIYERDKALDEALREKPPTP